MYKLLVVDDEKILLNGLCNYYPWEELGFEIVGKMTNGKSVLNYIAQNDVDVILTDVSMPIMNGIDLAIALHNNFPQIKVVFLSGYADFRYAQKALEYGVKNYILKPVKMDELKSVFLTLKNELDIENKKMNFIMKEENYYQRIIRIVEQYVKSNIINANLGEAAELVNLSPGYLSILYKKITRKNFSDFILQVRMEKAKGFLSDSKYQIYDIAENLGYKSPKNFSRAFKEYYGLSPREYRKTSGLYDC